MSARKARTEAAAVGAAPVDSEEKDVKIPVEAADVTEANEAPAAEAAENQVEDSNKEATMTEDEMVEAAIRAGEEAADNDFKLKFEQAQKELADVRNELDAAAEAQKAAEDKAKDATERTARLQADWENFRRRTANERIAERAIVVSHGLFGAMLRGAYADLDYTTTWLQELPQDAFFKLSGGRIERIAC